MKAALPILAAALIAVPAFSQEAPAAEIPWVRSQGIKDWQADGKRGLYIQSLKGDWYHARILGICSRLESALTVGFETSQLDQLDRYGAVLVEGRRCQLESVVRSDPPPRKVANR